VTAAAFVTVQGIVCYEFAHCDEVVQTDSLVEFDVHAFFLAGDEQLLLEFLADFRNIRTFALCFS
jgi:hypothetical protein